MDYEITASSLCRFKISDESLITEEFVKDEITRCFAEGRCFEFFPDMEIIHRLRGGESIEAFNDSVLAIRNRMYDTISRGDLTVRNRFFNDTRLSSRLISAIKFFHLAATDIRLDKLETRRIVLIKELPGVPTIYHISSETTVISRVGIGPVWSETPTIYLGLNTLDVIAFENKIGKSELFNAFVLLLMVEERAIETGYSHTALFTPEISKALNTLVDEVIKSTTVVKVEEQKVTARKETKKFTDKNRKSFLEKLNARLIDRLNFDYEINLKAMTALEKLARDYKKSDDQYSLREIVRLLVAASGHDIHEIRNRANIILERIFAPKEYDAPLAISFINHRIGTPHEFRFSLPKNRQGFTLRLYENPGKGLFVSEKNLSYQSIPLEYDSKTETYGYTHTFTIYGHYDFAVVKNSARNIQWVSQGDTNGRINVIPDLQGKIIIEIFPDIHGHTKTYWKDENSHPGLVYNENGEVIRLGNFSDITAHLEDLKERYYVTEIYLLGVQKRGSNRHDWAPGATSPSPFSPVSLVDMEPSLGGDEKFRELVEAAHSMGINVIVDIVPHINRYSSHLKDEFVVKTYGSDGQLVARSSTDGKYGSWNDGKLLNYRKFEIWEWLSGSITTLIEKFNIDGIRFDSAHAVPIMMKKNNFPYIYKENRSLEDMVEGDIIVNDRENDHYITTGYYDSACRDQIAVPLHFFIMQSVEKKMKEKGKNFFINAAECYWGHEKYLSRSGLVPYNSSLFKICENITHGKTDTREIYHIYDNYLPSVLPAGTELLGILGNHDERRALNTFGQRGLRAAVAMSIFMSNIIMDYEGSAEGEGWKVYLDNIFVNWNQFEYAAHRSLEGFYREWYRFHRNAKGPGRMVWANNNMVAAAMKFTEKTIWLGAFNFADSNQSASIQFDKPSLPIDDNDCFRLSDILYSDVTKIYNYYTGRELRISRINTVISYTERIKLFKLDKVELKENYQAFLKDSFNRICYMSNMDTVDSNFSYNEVMKYCNSFERIEFFIKNHLMPIFWENERDKLIIGLKRIIYHLYKNRILPGEDIRNYSKLMVESSDEIVRSIGESLRYHNQRGSLVFMSAEADPFSKSGGLANVVYELPRELVRLGEIVHVITGLYRHGSDQVVEKMNRAITMYGVKYTGKNVRFMIMGGEYEVGVHHGIVDGIHYYLLDHPEFFDGLYWGVTSAEKLRRRIAFARASAEVIVKFDLNPHFTFTNDAYTGLFNGIVKNDSYYMNNSNFDRNTFLHIIHNGGWQYFDAYQRYENGFDLYSLFNLPQWCAGGFHDPVYHDRLNCMAAGIRHADRSMTVSPSYARQIEFACDGLEHILSKVIGISNAIGHDYREKLNINFAKSNFIENNYTKLLRHIKENHGLMEKIGTRYPEILKGWNFNHIEDRMRRGIVRRTLNKLLLQNEKSLTVDPDLVIFTMIHRVSEQKGYQILLEASEGIFKNLKFQAIIGGAISSGDRRGEEIAHGLYMLGRYYPGMASVSIGFQDVTIPLLSSDIFCMPSLHEPGGISQLEGFAAGCLVVARATGGLKDTVFPVITRGEEVEGNGFLFSDFSSWAFYDAMERASHFFKSNDDTMIYKARRNAEKTVYFWDTPARQYITEIYDMTERVRILD